MSTVIFDLDGTLVDSAEVLRDVGNTVLAERGLTLMETDEARSYIGNGARVFVTKMLTARDAVDPETFEAIFERYSALYAAAPGAANIPFPHVDETLRQLVSLGHRLALCTNKPTAPTDVLLAARRVNWVRPRSFMSGIAKSTLRLLTLLGSRSSSTPKGSVWSRRTHWFSRRRSMTSGHCRRR